MFVHRMVAIALFLTVYLTLMCSDSVGSVKKVIQNQIIYILFDPINIKTLVKLKLMM